MMIMYPYANVHKAQRDVNQCRSDILIQIAYISIIACM